ncbi:MAG: sporulation protein YqfC [Clostridium sp.]
MEEKINKGKEFVADKLQMPREVIFDIPRIVITGNEEITIEHHKGIITFDKENIRVNSKLGPIKVSGKNFEILFIGSTSITVSGKFKAIEYEGVHHD